MGSRRGGTATRLVGVLIALALGAGACAPRGLPPAPTSPSHPDFLYPAVPGVFTDQSLLRWQEGGWRYLQFNNLGNAEREFHSALRREPRFYPAEAGLGWVALARRDAAGALARFDRAVAADGAYPSALVGRGQALLALDRESDALETFERALAVDAGLADVSRRVELLRVRTLQARIGEARASAEAGRWEEARVAYLAATAASPDSAFLYRDLAVVERRIGRVDEALAHAKQAIALDPNDAASHALLGDLLTARDDFDGALAAYARAREVDPSPANERAWAEARARTEFARMPAPYRDIPDAPSVTRGELAAIVGVRLADLLASAPARQVVVTDVRGHWAQQWIMTAARTGVVEAFPNYTFQPAAPVRRGDLAAVVARVLGLIASARPEAAAAWQGTRPAVADVPPGHLSYPAVAFAVGAGVMPLDAEGRFHLLQPVSGALAFEVVRRLEALAGR